MDADHKGVVPDMRSDCDIIVHALSGKTNEGIASHLTYGPFESAGHTCDCIAAEHIMRSFCLE